MPKKNGNKTTCSRLTDPLTVAYISAHPKPNKFKNLRPTSFQIPEGP